MRVVIFTDRYPYGQYEEAFVTNEVAYLAAHQQGCNVEIVPLKGDDVRRDVPDGVAIAQPLLNGMGVKKWLGMLLRLLFRRSFWLFLGDTFRHLGRGVRLERVWFTRYFSGELVADYAARAMAKDEEGVLYSYWMSYGALGVALAKCRLKEGDRWKFVCRAHGYDIRDGEKSIPLREFTWRWLDAVFPVSTYGAEVLSVQRGALPLKVHVAYLGVHGVAQPPAAVVDRNKVLFVSCSGAKAVKRLDLMLRLIEAFASSNGKLQVVWEHFGDGELLANLQESAAQAMQRCGNLHVVWRGAVDNAEVLRAYQSLGGAIFLNTSESEGLPVSIMEALSAGFPTVATEVGGTAEALRDGAGELISAAPWPQEFMGAVCKVRESYTQYSQRAREVFEERFWAEQNYKDFYSKILGA